MLVNSAGKLKFWMQPKSVADSGTKHKKDYHQTIQLAALETQILSYCSGKEVLFNQF